MRPGRNYALVLCNDFRGNLLVLFRTMCKSVKGPYKIMQNFNSLECLVLEISAFQYEACHGFRAGASVHKLVVGGVWRTPRNIHTVANRLGKSIAWNAGIFVVYIYIYDVAYTIAVTGAKYKSKLENTKDTPYLVLAGGLWGVFYGNVWENLLRYNGTALYMC